MFWPKKWKRKVKHYMNIEDAKEAVRLITEIGNKYNVKIWMQYGTLLGNVRDGQFIPHDKDLDFAVDYDSWNGAILKDLYMSGFVIHNHVFSYDHFLPYIGKNKMNVITKARLNYKGIPICLDILHRGIKKHGDYMLCAQPYEERYLLKLPRDILFPIGKGVFYGLEVWIPNNYIGFLELVYGANWRIPMEYYIHSEEHEENSKNFVLWLKEPKEKEDE